MCPQTRPSRKDGTPENRVQETTTYPRNITVRHSCERRNPENSTCKHNVRTSADYPPLPPPTRRGGRD